MSLEEVKKKYLQEALGKPIQKYGVDLGGGRFTSLSDAAGFMPNLARNRLRQK